MLDILPSWVVMGAFIGGCVYIVWYTIRRFDD